MVRGKLALGAETGRPLSRAEDTEAEKVEAERVEADMTDTPMVDTDRISAGA